MAKRYNVFLDEALAEVIEAKAKADFGKPVDWIKRVIVDHVNGKCTASVMVAAPAAAPEGPARGRGRPAGGSIEASATYDAVMKGDPATVTAALIACGFFPPEGREKISGDPKNPTKRMDHLVKEITKERIYDIRVSKLNKAELEYVVSERTYNVPVDGEVSVSSSVRTSTRSELWNQVKSEARG